MKEEKTILQVRDLHVHFPVKRGIIIKKTVAEVKERKMPNWRCCVLIPRNASEPKDF